MTLLDDSPTGEFDRQLRNLVARGYPALCDLPEAEFVALFEPLRREDSETAGDGLGRAPFVIVPPRGLLRTEEIVPRMNSPGNPDSSS